VKAKRAVPLVLTLVVVALLALPAFASAAPQTLKVDGLTGADSGTCVASPCATIAYAISQAAAHDTVAVAAGHYEEDLSIDQPLTLEGATGGGTVIGPLGTAVVVAGSTIATTGGEIDDVTISHVAEVGLGPSHVPATVAAGLEISVPTDGWTIADSSFDLNYFGIVVNDESTDMTVVDSSFTHDRSGFYTQRTEPSAGVFVGEVDGLELRGCDFIEDQYRGLYFEGLSNARIEDVTVVKAGATAPTHPFGARAISFNLKSGAYENIVVAGANVIEAENEGISIQVRGSADDSPTYQAHPATLDSIEVTESTVIDNDGPGIVVENSTQLGTATITDSRIVGNARDGLPSGATASGIDAWDEGGGAPTVDAADNWFGCNAGPTAAGAGCDTVNGPVDAGPWLVLTGAAAAPVLAPGGTTQVRAAIDSNSAGQPAAGLPDGTPVAATFAAANGIVTPGSAELAGGEARTTYIAGLVGDAGVTATVDDQTVAVPLTVQLPAEPPVEVPAEGPAEEMKSEAPPASNPAPPPAPTTPVKIETTETKTPPTVAPSGNVKVATVGCASSSCQVEATKPTITIGGQNYKIKVRVPATVAGGASAPVKVILPKKVREALEEKGTGKVKVKVTVTTAEGQRKTVTVTVVVKARKGKKG